MATAIIFVALFATCFGIFFLYLTTRNRERMGLIEKGADASLFTGSREARVPRQKTSSVRFSLKAGMLIIGTGIGFIVSFILYRWAWLSDEFDSMTFRNFFPLVVVGIVFVCGGIGLVSGYYLGRALDKKDFKQ